ncbi:MAG: spore maturation protein A [Ruminiclostridium sp.]|nr:spore maturation protein A [Ruminiclostridium sp.]
MMKYIMTGLVAAAFVFAALTGRMEELSTSFLEECGNAVQLAITLTGVIVLWSGLMRVAQSSGLTEKLAALAAPVLSKLFGGLKRGGKAMQYITLNITANILGLGNASTPFGIAAMREIEREERSPDPQTASANMITLTVMNTASLQLIPTTAAALRLKYGSAAPMEILPCVWISSVCTLAAALTCCAVCRRAERRRRL